MSAITIRPPPWVDNTPGSINEDRSKTPVPTAAAQPPAPGTGNRQQGNGLAGWAGRGSCWTCRLLSVGSGSWSRPDRRCGSGFFSVRAPRMVLPPTATTLRPSMVPGGYASRFSGGPRGLLGSGPGDLCGCWTPTAASAPLPGPETSGRTGSGQWFATRLPSGSGIRPAPLHGQGQDRGLVVAHAPPVSGVGHGPENLSQGLARQGGCGGG